MAETFGQYMRRVRTAKVAVDPAYSLRQMAARLGTTPAHLSNIETGKFGAPEDDLLGRVADDLGQDRDIFFAAAGKITPKLKNIIMKRPELIASFLRQIEKLPDDAILRLVREVRDGDW